MAWLVMNSEMFPWHMTIWAWSERKVFFTMMVSLVKDLAWKYCIISVVTCGTCVLLWLEVNRRGIPHDIGNSMRHLSPPLLPVSCRQEIRLLSNTPRTCYTRHPVLGLWLIIAFYFALSMTARPVEPYQKLSTTPFVSVPLEIRRGFRESHNEQLMNRGNQTSNVTHSIDDIWDEILRKRSIKQGTSNDEPLNVVLVFLESVRSDMMPFNSSTEWAKRYLVNRGEEYEHVTPFFNRLVQNPSTLHFPSIKSASGFTAKSLFSTLCSRYSLPLYHTREHTSKLCRQCLPRILQKLGYATQFFQSPTETFDHQREMLQNIGFPGIFGKETFDSLYNTTQEFAERHTTNYFGYDDNVFLEPIMDWVDNQTSKGSPFFFSYLSGVTHDPYNRPPAASWRRRTFSRHKTANGYLNGLSYTDSFLRKLVVEFEKRGLMESTLFVFVGDHGGDFADRGAIFKTWSVPFEEAFNVGVTFHARHKEWSRLIGQLDQKRGGVWSSIDILPTILEIVLPGVSQVLFSDRQTTRAFDGRSMLGPSGQRLTLSIPNPGCGMVLRDRSFLIVVNCDESRATTRVYDLEADPGQKSRLFLTKGVARSDMRGKKLLAWGEKAFQFLESFKADIVEAHRTGIPCLNCTLSSLQHLKTLNDWNSSPTSSTSVP
eukprot:scaffold1377_cov126-Cylindrotheca_fusiformis.AAC.25